MSKRSRRSSSRISDHKRRGKQLIPPLMDMEGMTLQPWLQDVLPDMLWSCFHMVHAGQQVGMRTIEDGSTRTRPHNASSQSAAKLSGSTVCHSCCLRGRSGSRPPSTAGTMGGAAAGSHSRIPCMSIPLHEAVAFGVRREPATGPAPVVRTSRKLGERSSSVFEALGSAQELESEWTRFRCLRGSCRDLK